MASVDFAHTGLVIWSIWLTVQPRSVDNIITKFKINRQVNSFDNIALVVAITRVKK